MVGIADKPLVFISYAHAVAAEAELARTLAQRLPEAGCRIFLDRDIALGATWDDHVAEALATCDAFVVLLSAASLASPMVCEEIARIGERRRRAPGFPKLLPVHVGSIGTVPYRIAGYLNEVQHTRWNGDPDTAGLIDVLRDRLRDLIEHRGDLPSLCTLPGRTLDFTGRQKELDDLCAALVGSGRATISALGGMGGVGKTTLAIQAAWHVAPMFPDGVLYLNLGGVGGEPLAPQQAMARLIERIEPTAKLPDDLPRLQETYRSLLAHRRMLLLLDNARDAAQLRPLLPPEPVALLATSRVPLRLPGVQPLELEALPQAEALALLRSALHGRQVDDADLAGIAAAGARLPIALRAAGAFLAEHPGWTIAEYLAALAQQPLPHLASEDEPALDVATVLSFSIERLATERPALAQRWQLLVVFPGDFASDAAAAVWNAEPRDANDDLGRLAARSLLLHDAATGRWRLHDLYRELAKSRADKDLLEHTRERHAQWYCGVLRRTREQYQSGGKAAIDGLAAFDLERLHIVAAQQWASTNITNNQTAAEISFHLCDSAAHVMFLRFTSDECISWLQASVSACRKLKWNKEEYYSLGNLALAEAMSGNTWASIRHLDEVLQLAIKFDETKAIGLTILNLGARWNELGAFAEFQFHSLYLSSLGYTILEYIISDNELDNKELLRNKSNAIMNIGNALSTLGLTSEALYYLNMSSSMYEEATDERGKADSMFNTARTLARSGKLDSAVSIAIRAMKLCRSIKHPGTPSIEAWLRERGIDPEEP